MKLSKLISLLKEEEEIGPERAAEILVDLGYEDAVKNAPPGVANRLLEFANLPEEEREDTTLLYYILGTGTPAYKMSQELSEYDPEGGSAEQNCGNCEYMYLKLKTGQYICSHIRGEVHFKGWCKLWKGYDFPFDDE